MKEVEIIIDGKKYPCQISDEAATKIKNVSKRTGYEREYDDNEYWYHSEEEDDGVDYYHDCQDESDELLYNNGNYYNSKELAINVARADRLLQKLRQWQALNDAPVDWSEDTVKYTIGYDYNSDLLYCKSVQSCRNLGDIYFSSETKVSEVMRIFRDDLIWYFTEYKPRLDEKSNKNDT